MLDVAERTPILHRGETVDGRYRIVDKVADGGMSTVYLAEHMLIKRRVAIKVLHPELASDMSVVQMFMNEARAAGTLGHPNIVESTDMGFTRKAVPYIVYEYIEGSLLAEEIYRVGGLPVRRALRIAIQIASALDAAHQAKIVHLDLKSDNVILTDHEGVTDHVKVLDFGISKFMAADTERTQRNLVMGTPAFMAPEQVTQPDDVDHRADIYALGVVLYEMLSARRPFASSNAQILLYRLVNERPAPLDLPTIPPALDALIFDKLLAKDRSQRFQSMQEVQAALEAIADVLRAADSIRVAVDTDAYDDVSIEPIQPKRRLRLGWFAAAAIAALAAGGLRYAETRVVDSTDDAAQTALRSDAAKIAATLEAQAREASARAAGIAGSPLVRAAVETDAATVIDLHHDGQLPIVAESGEVIELSQLRGMTSASLLRLPATAPALPVTSEVALARVAGSVSLIAVAPVSGQSSKVAGSLAIARPVDLRYITQLVGEDAAVATLIGLGAPVPLVGGREPTDGIAVTVPIVLTREIAVGDLALAATIRRVPRGATLGLASDVGFACAGALTLIFGLASLRRPRMRRAML